MNKQALLIIDIQNDYFTGGNMALDRSNEAGEATARILKYFRKKTQPVIHIQHESVRSGATFFLPKTKGAKIHEKVLPISGEPVIIKNFPNSFRATELKQQLDKLGVNELVITGMMSNMCVDATTRAAFDLGYACTVIHDACCAANLEFNGVKVESDKVHTSFMAALGAVYATMLSADEFMN